jgi:hypothetical protein
MSAEHLASEQACSAPRHRPCQSRQECFSIMHWETTTIYAKLRHNGQCGTSSEHLAGLPMHAMDMQRQRSLKFATSFTPLHHCSVR